MTCSKLRTLNVHYVISSMDIAILIADFEFLWKKLYTRQVFDVTTCMLDNSVNGTLVSRFNEQPLQ